MKSILFVCTGNTCRSPMAEVLFRKMMAGSSTKVSSAGLHAAGGLSANPIAIEVMAEEGIDLSSFRSQPVTFNLIERATHVFAMTQNHLYELVRLYPQAKEKFFLLSEGTTQEDIPDPIGGSLQTYQHCCESIQLALENIRTSINK